MAISEKEKLFCGFYFENRNPRTAAAMAGYTLLPHRRGMKLLHRRDIQREIRRLSESASISLEETVSGYRTLAFGSVADAIKLLNATEPLTDKEIERLDLFNVSEIKKPKGGGIEIKFFDRLKAIEHLEELSKCSLTENSALPFYTALEKSANALKGDFDE